MHWLYRVPEFKEILDRCNDEDDEEGSVKHTKEELLPLLEKAPFQSLGKAVLENLRGATTFHTLNRALDDVYDYADEWRIWLGP